jgi:hypothetical protein
MKLSKLFKLRQGYYNMRIEEILRALADTLEQHGQSEVQSAQPQMAVVQAEPSGEVVDQHGAAEQPDGVFIPPLQLKIELLKKAVDVDNVYDHTAEMDADNSEQEMPIKEDEIVALRRAAGINPAVIQELANDEPLDD